MEYRVESLGFLYLATSDAPGNQGLHDQSLAIEWIHKNIKQFGGDPERITLFGESAGAVSVGLHLLSPKSRPFFNNAILESSGPSAKWAVLSPQIAKYRSEKFLDVFTRYISERYESGPSDPEYAYIPSECKTRMVTMEEKFQCVKNYPILSQNHFRSSWAIESYNGGPIGYTFVPTVDADFIPYDPEQMLMKGDFKKCPLLLGVNKDEGSYFIVYVPYGNMSIDSWAHVDHKTFKHAMKEYFRYMPTYPTERSPMLLESILQTYTLWGDYNNTIQNAIQLNLAVGERRWRWRWRPRYCVVVVVFFASWLDLIMFIFVPFRRLSFHVSNGVPGRYLCPREPPGVFLSLHCACFNKSMASMDGCSSW